MKRTILPFAAVVCSFIACNKIWVGGKEELVFKYHYQFSQPEITGPEKQTEFIAFSNAEATDIGDGTVRITIDGIRVENNRHNYSIDEIIVSEKRDGDRWEIQDEFSDDAESYKTSIAAVLVLDMSTSISEAGLNDDLKQYAKDFAKKITESTPESAVAVVFFNDESWSTNFYTSAGISELNAVIDSFADYRDRTALFEATMAGISLLDNYSFSGEKALAVFTDGGDNASDNPDDLRGTIEANDLFRIAIGLKGQDLDKDDIELIASEKKYSIIADKAKDLEPIFDDVAKRITSVYTVNYNRSDQRLDNEILVKFEFKVDKIKN